MIDGLENLIYDALEKNEELVSLTNRINNKIKGKVSFRNTYVLHILPEIMRINLDFLEMISSIIEENSIQEMDNNEILSTIDSCLDIIETYIFQGLLDNIKLPDIYKEQLNKIRDSVKYMTQSIYLEKLNSEIDYLKDNYDVDSNYIKEELKEFYEERNNIKKYLDDHSNWLL